MRSCQAALLVLMGCTTVRTGRELQGTEVSPPRWRPVALVVTAAPQEYPPVLLDVVEERVCDTTVTERWLERREMRVSDTVMQWTSVGVGAAVGLGAYLALSALHPPRAASSGPGGPGS